LLQTDTEILQGLKENDEGAFSEIMKKYYPSLYRYGQHFTHDETIILDCIQDVFINLWQNRHKTEPISFLKQYLLTALKRRIIRVTGQNKKNLSVAGEEIQGYDFALEFSIEDLIVEKQLNEEKAARLRKILDRLPNRQKEVIYLIYYQQLDHQQVAGIMQINKQSVYNLLSEGLRKIRVFWQEVSLLGLLLLRCF
jgi:RNA polymerase sigma factor (sigma-70 family)